MLGLILFDPWQHKIFKAADVHLLIVLLHV